MFTLKYLLISLLIIVMPFNDIHVHIHMFNFIHMLQNEHFLHL